MTTDKVARQKFSIEWWKRQSIENAEKMRQVMSLERYYKTPTILFWLKDPTPLATRCKTFSISEKQAMDKGLPVKGLIQNGVDADIELYAREWLLDVVTLPEGFTLVSVFLKADSMWYFNVSHSSFPIGIGEPEPLLEYHYTLPDKPVTVERIESKSRQP